MSASKTTAIIDKLLCDFSPERSNIIPILQAVQGRMGYLPREAIERISDYTKIPEAEILGVASFYAQFRFKPVGKHIFTVCRGTACHVRGSARILRELEKEIGVKSGETTDDMLFSLETVACLGSCALAPVMVIDKTVYGSLTTTKAKALANSFRKKGKKPKPPQKTKPKKIILNLPGRVRGTDYGTD